MTIEEQFQQAFLRREEIQSLLATNEEMTEKVVSEVTRLNAQKTALEEERKNLRVEREKLSRSLDQLQTAKTIQTHEQAVTEARVKTEAAQAEAETFKASLEAQKLEGEKLLAQLRAQVEQSAATKVE